MKKTPDLLSDEEILDLYFDRNGEAIAETERKYGSYIRAVAGNFVSDKEDVKECENDAYLGIWNTVPPKRPQSLKSYIGRLARNIAVSKYRETAAEKRAACGYAASLDELSEAIPSFDNADAFIVRDVMKAFINGLNSRDAAIFVRRYYYAEGFERIAEETGLSVAGVFKALDRMKSQLKEQLEKEGINV